MIKPYELLEGVLSEIEKNLKGDISDSILADKFSLSQGYLRQLFRFAFNQPLGTYIRSRKLAASIDDLLNTDMNILDIVLEYGLEYEQSYIRTFKREFGITPGELRKSGHIVKITPPLHLFDSNKLGDGLIFGPDIVIIPQFHVAGKKQKVPFHKILTMDMPIAKHFFYNERQNIPNAVNPDTLVYLCSGDNTDGDYIYLLPSVQVKSLDNIPEGYEPYTFPTSLCANFRFINCDFDEVNMHTADDMFKAIDDFNGSEEQKYFIRRGLNIDKFDLSNRNENYCQWEWFAPVIEKTLLDIPPFNPSGIKKVYKQELPALRFIGKKYIETPETENILNLLDNWLLNDWFNAIEKQSGADYKTLFEDGGAYINLVQKKEGPSKEGTFKEGSVFEHWMGMFAPKGTEVPQGFEAIDFPKSKLTVCSVYGKRNEIVNYETECRNKLAEEGFVLKNTRWFRRFNWRRFFETDIYGKRTLEYCYFI